MWVEHLWPNRTDAIESNSAMNLLDERQLSKDTEHPLWENVQTYDLENMKTTPTFWGAFHNDKLVGVNSGHMCIDKLYRSRGLFVLSEYRNLQIAQKLLMKTISQAKHEGAIACWSFPKQSVEKVYLRQDLISAGPEFFFNYVESLSSKGEIIVNIKAVRVFDVKAFDSYCNSKNR